MTSPAAVPDTALNRFFAGLRRSQVRRVPHSPIGGVCAGIAARLDLSVTVVRLLAFVMALLGPAVGLYLVAWLLLPDHDGGLHLERALRRGEGRSVVLLVVTVLAVVGDLGAHSRIGWLSLALVVVAVWALTRARTLPTPAPPAASAPDAGPR